MEKAMEGKIILLGKIGFISFLVSLLLFILLAIHIVGAFNHHPSKSEIVNEEYKMDANRNTLSSFIHDKRQWIRFGAYVALPHFFVKTGYIQTEIHGSDRNLLSIATFCYLSLLQDAREIATSYQSGPISVAVYIDQDYNQQNTKSFIELKDLIEQTFSDINNKYNIIIGLLYFDELSQFYIEKKFMASTPMMFELPNNALRNLAEYQISTTWLFNIDIHFIYFSDSFSYNKISATLKQLSNIINTPEIGNKSIFIVPSFEVLRQDLDATKTMNRYQSLTKNQLINLTKTRNSEITPFRTGINAQKCINYEEWYTRNGSEFSYSVRYENDRNCTWNYIINTEILESFKYQWDNKFVATGLNEANRIFDLHHYSFNFHVLSDLFIIHKSKPSHLH